MDDYISKLPDDILIQLVSLLPMRDAVRTRSLSHKWKDIPDCRSILEFTALSVFGDGTDKCHSQANFVKAVNQFLEIWKAPKVSKFKLKFGLSKAYASHIDEWIASCVTKKRVEELNLDLNSYDSPCYLFPCHLLHPETEASSCLKHLRLAHCRLTLCSGCKSWLTQLTTLELDCVTLLKSDINRILSADMNLTSLTMIWSNSIIDPLNVKLPYLKKFVVQTRSPIDLDCPNLEIFDYNSKCCHRITFSHLPCLREVYLHIFCEKDGCCSTKFVRHLTTNAPNLHYLYLRVHTEVPPMLSSIVANSLKQLHLRLCVPAGFDLFTITDFLHATPTLEVLHIEMWYRLEIKWSNKRQFLDRQHFRLRKVTFERYSEMWKEIDFVKYLLRNSIALEELVIVPIRNYSQYKRELNFNLLQGVHPTAEVIISHPK